MRNINSELRPYAIEYTRINGVKDDFGFLAEFNNWSNHRGLLLLGLHLTTGKVLELGCGNGSTPFLHKYCEASGRPLLSVETNREWYNKFDYNEDQKSSFHSVCCREDIEGFESLFKASGPYGLAFVDHAPGEHRKVAVDRLIDKAQIICVHDTEIGGAGDYGFEPVFAKFKFRLNYNKTGGGAGATLVSNKIDVNRFRGLSLGPYTFDND